MSYLGYRQPDDDGVRIGPDDVLVDGDWLNMKITALATLEARADLVLELHSRGETTYEPGEGMVTTVDDAIVDGCQYCQRPWPCQTVQLLDPTPLNTSKEDE